MHFKKISTILIAILLFLTMCFSFAGCSFKTEPEIYTPIESTNNDTPQSQIKDPLINCEDCKLKYWGNEENGGFSMIVYNELITGTWSNGEEVTFASSCIKCKKEISECTCVSNNASQTQGTTNSISSSESIQVTICEECGLDSFDCICSSKCKESGCERYIADCGCELTNHKCDPNVSYSHGHSESHSVSNSIGSGIVESAINVAQNALNQINESIGTPTKKCEICGATESSCICSEECKKAGCEIKKEECGCEIPHHNCESHKNTFTSHGHSVSTTASLKDKTGYEKTEKGYNVFCFNGCKLHKIEF